MQNSRITTSGSILFGKPRIRGTRISVMQVLNCLEQGWSYAKIQKELGIEKEDIQACLSYASQLTENTRKIFIRKELARA